ncbi:hypothetical protein WI664_16880 [Vibrio cholerae]
MPPAQRRCWACLDGAGRCWAQRAAVKRFSGVGIGEALETQQVGMPLRRVARPLYRGHGRSAVI